MTNPNADRIELRSKKPPDRAHVLQSWIVALRNHNVEAEPPTGCQRHHVGAREKAEGHIRGQPLERLTQKKYPTRACNNCRQPGPFDLRQSQSLYPDCGIEMVVRRGTGCLECYQGYKPASRGPLVGENIDDMLGATGAQSRQHDQHVRPAQANAWIGRNGIVIRKCQADAIVHRSFPILQS